ncbi:MAG: DUF3291 domain-containing protein [Alphaproteobacteria bacterium]|nr:DUF3291 domain-containing protein [Alphaproteobacteria bacterium]
MHLAELNIAEALCDLDDPQIADFVNNLDRINALAERMPGYVWRLKDSSGDATAIDWDDNPRMIVNMSVWESAKDLENFVFNTVHRQIYKRRAEWFSTMKSHHFVMWWVPVGHAPDIAEAREKLTHLDTHGPTQTAFGWDELISGDALWRDARCA